MNLLEDEKNLRKEGLSLEYLLVDFRVYFFFSNWYFKGNDLEDEIKFVYSNLKNISSEVENFEIQECENAIENTILAKWLN